MAKVPAALEKEHQLLFTVMQDEICESHVCSDT
jgi:hypothetical protein